MEWQRGYPKRRPWDSAAAWWWTPRTTNALLDLIKQWHQDGRTVIAVLHDDAQVLAHFPQTLLLARELVAWGDTSQVLTPGHLDKARALAEAWDDQAEICHSDEHAAQP